MGPQAGVLGLTMAGLIEVTEWCLVFALLWIWKSSFGWFMVRLGDWLDLSRYHVSILHLPDLGGPIRAAESVIRTWLKDEKRGLEIEIAWTWHALRQTFLATAQTLEWLVQEVDATYDWFENHLLKRWAKWVADNLVAGGLIAKLITAVAAKLRPQIVKETRVIEKAVPQAVNQYVTYSVPAALPGALGLPKIRRDIGSLWRWRAKAEKRLGRLERITAAGVFAGLLANALGIATRCVRSGNVRKTARRVCGMDSSLLDSMLADGLAILGVVSVVEFAESLQAIEDEAVKIMGGLIKEWPS